MKPTLLILAAGLGSRYGNLKQIEKFGPSGETIMDYSVFDAQRAGFGKIVFVLRKDILADFEQVIRPKYKDIEVSYVLQELDNLPEGIAVSAERQKPWGTGHAVLVAASQIKEPFAVINADDFYGSHAFDTISQFLQNIPQQGVSCAIVGYQLLNILSEFGAVSRGVCKADQNGILESITERTQINQDENGIFYIENEQKFPLTADTAVSMNLIGFSANAFVYFEKYFREFIEQNAHELKAEFYLPTVVNNLVKEGISEVNLLQTQSKWFGITYKEDRISASKRLAELVEGGVYPKTLF